MTRDETHALLAKGKSAWNAWAEALLAERAKLTSQGLWVETPYRKASVAPKSEAARSWMHKARADVSSFEAPHVFASSFNFEGWSFPGDVDFTGAVFADVARFDGATFSGHAEFAHVVFQSHARFGEATFVGDADFDHAIFSADARFGEVVFKGGSRFTHTLMAGDARFSEATFGGDAVFEAAMFEADARFGEAIFLRDAVFTHAQAKRNARFHGVRFKGSGWFDKTIFGGQAGFGQCTFEGYGSFVEASFGQAADFSAMHADRAFNLAHAQFHQLPDFIQAHFAEAPRLDNVRFRQRPAEGGSVWAGTKSIANVRFAGEEGASARWRALRRLAIQGHDHEREMDFFAGEIKSARFVTDYPFAWPPWKLDAWSGVLRYVSGLLFQLLSDFGRSLARPMLVWLSVVAISTFYFLGQNPDVLSAREAQVRAGRSDGLLLYLTTTWTAWERGQPCYNGMSETNAKGELMITGLSSPVRRATTAATEALHLALRNAFVILDNGSDAAHRTFGCLYGVERFGDNFVAVVPSVVSFAATLQRALSGLLIFLFGLGLRTMLRVL